MIKRITRTSTNPDCYFVKLLDAKQQLRIENDFTEDDVYINALLAVAMDKVERITDKVWQESTYQIIYDDVLTGSMALEIRRENVISVDSIAYLDSDNSVQTIALADVIIDLDGGHIYPVNDWPSNMKDIRLNVTMGVDSDKLPPSVKQAVLLYVTDFYEQRQTLSEAKVYDNQAAINLLYTYRRLGL